MIRPTAWLLVASLMSGTSVLAADAPMKELPPLMSSTQAINYYITEGWEKAGIKKPAPKATDLEFHRRAFIDLVGRIPTVAEVLDFEADTASTKRAKLIRRLLYGMKNEKGEDVNFKPLVAGKPVLVDGKPLSFEYPQEYAEHWANMWTIWLMSRTTHATYREQMQSWLGDKFASNIPHNELVKLLIGAQGETSKNGAVNFVLHHLGEKPTLGTDPGYSDAVPITSRITRLFTGLQTQCTQCHDHPFNKEWIQSDFWGVNAFFRQTRRSGNPTPRPGVGAQMMAFVQVSLSDDEVVNKESRVLFERRDGKMMSSKPTFLKDYAQADKGEFSTKKLPPEMAGKTRRQILADYVVQHDNFAKAYVNRIWGHLFGRGLNKEPTIDDFGSHNEVVHPELLEKLAGDFVKYGYDSKALLEAICNSDVYGLSHVANKEYADEKFNPYFARMPLKALSPETLHASLTQATKAHDEVVDKKDGRSTREAWLEKLVRNFGDDEGNELTFNGTVVQALLMMNGSELNKAITKKGSNVIEGIMGRHKKLTGKAFSTAVIDDLFLTTVSRHATPKELAALIDVQDGIVVPKRDDKTSAGTTPVAPATATKPPVKAPVVPAKPPAGTKPAKPASEVIAGSYANDPVFYQDVFWALMNTTEFMLNH